MVQHHLGIEPVGVGADEDTISPYRFTDVASILQGTAVSYKCNRKKSAYLSDLCLFIRYNRLRAQLPPMQSPKSPHAAVLHHTTVTSSGIRTIQD